MKEFWAHLALDEYVKGYWDQFGDEWGPKLPQAIRAGSTIPPYQGK